MSNFRYKPEDYPYPLNEDMENVYKAYNKVDGLDDDYLEYYVGRVHLTLKQAAVAHVLSTKKVEEMQKYFWGLLDK